MSLSIIILAAGSGTRMKSNTPKVLHKICGEELLFYSIENALELSDDVRIILYHQAQRVQEACERRFGEKVKFHIQDFENFPGTGGALMQKGAMIPTAYKKVLILNGDMPLITTTSLKNLTSHTSPVTLGVIESKNPYGYGRVLIENGRVQAIIEEKDANEEIKKICTINSGIYVFDTEVLAKFLPLLNNHNAQGEYYLTDVIKLCVDEGYEIESVILDEEEFSGINDKAQLASAEEVMLKRLRERAMRDGVIMHLPHSIYIEKNVRFEGECEIEQGVQIFGETLIKDSHIKAHSTIRDSQIICSDIGPMAHIRPNSHIEKTHIGNFVEVKNSKLYSIKAGHLSYLGDSEIDEGTNIGAGVITCNYDGKSKHKTKIGKNVFVGSDTQLIAPLNIADHTLIGAGSTIRKDSKEGDLLVSRSEQRNLENGYFAFFKDKK